MNKFFEEDGDILFKRLGSPCRFRAFKYWMKTKYQKHPLCDGETVGICGGFNQLHCRSCGWSTLAMSFLWPRVWPEMLAVVAATRRHIGR